MKKRIVALIFVGIIINLGFIIGACDNNNICDANEDCMECNDCKINCESRGGTCVEYLNKVIG